MRKFAAFLLRVLGWTVDDGIAPEPKCILLGVPHTSIWDFVISFLYYYSCGGNAKCMVKKELFVPVLGRLIRAMGGIPVDRQNSATLVRSVIKEMEAAETFHLAIAPEGTRKPVRRWKSGFHLIARTAQVPVYLAYFDWGTKHIGHGPRFELTDDPQADLRRIQQIYKAMHLTGKHPEKYLTEC